MAHKGGRFHGHPRTPPDWPYTKPTVSGRVPVCLLHRPSWPFPSITYDHGRPSAREPPTQTLFGLVTQRGGGILRDEPKERLRRRLSARRCLGVRLLLNFGVDWEDKPFCTVFDHVSGYLEVSQKFSAARRILVFENVINTVFRAGYITSTS